MQARDLQAAIAAASSTAFELGLRAAETVLLQDANRIAVRLLPGDVLARVAPVVIQATAEFELEVARRLADSGCPVGAPDPRVEPRVYLRDGFAITFWTYYEPVSLDAVEPAEYADALARLHAGMRGIDLPSPHFTERVEHAQQVVGSHDRSPDLIDGDREFLANTLRSLRTAVERSGAPEQLLHSEPHPGNLLQTKDGLLFIDFETCCRGPVEFDVAGTSGKVGRYYPGIDQRLLAACRALTLALVASWRSDRADQYPEGRKMRGELLDRIRAMVERYALDVGG